MRSVAMIARVAELWLVRGYGDYDFEHAVEQLGLLRANALGLVDDAVEREGSTEWVHVGRRRRLTKRGLPGARDHPPASGVGVELRMPFKHFRQPRLQAVHRKSDRDTAKPLNAGSGSGADECSQSIDHIVSRAGNGDAVDPVLPSSRPVRMSKSGGAGCPHCKRVKKFLVAHSVPYDVGRPRRKPGNHSGVPRRNFWIGTRRAVRGPGPSLRGRTPISLSVARLPLVKNSFLQQ